VTCGEIPGLVSLKLHSSHEGKKGSRLIWPLLLTLEAVYYGPKITESYC